jgi:lysozyme
MPLRARLVPLVPLAACFAAGCGLPEDGVGESARAVHTVCAQSGSTVEGIDVSVWQGTVDWAAVSGAGIKYAFVRVSHGTGTIDTQFPANWPGTRAHGIIRGAYQYFMPGQDAVAQAQLVVDQLNAAGGLEADDLPCVVDIEDMDGQSATQVMAALHTWVSFIEDATGKRPIIYTGSYFWDDNGLDDTLASYPLWGPNYTSNACPLIANPWDHWRFWQYSSTGSVAGITTNVDRDRFDGTLADLLAFVAASNLGQDGGVDAAPPPQDAAAQDAAAQDAAPEDGAATADDGGTVADGAAADGAPLGDGATAADGPGAPGPHAIGSGCACRAGAPGGPAPVAALLALAVLLPRRRRGARRP